MENGTYVSPPLPPAAAAFQAAASASNSVVTPFQEALMSRMGRPFGLTTADMKDLPGSPFLGLAAAARGVTPGNLDGFTAAAAGGLPGALALSQMTGQPGFHHFIDPRLPFSGAFRPFFGQAAAAAAAAASLNSGTSGGNPKEQRTNPGIGKNSDSAFAPPAKGQTSPGSSTLFSPGQNLYPRSSGSPRTPSSSPPHHHQRRSSGNSGNNGTGSGNKLPPDENSNTAHSLIDRHGDRERGADSPASMDSNILDEEQQRAAKKIRLSGNEVGCCCPICGMPLRTSDLEAHYTQELEYLAKLSASILVNQSRGRSPSSHLMSPGLKNQLSPMSNSLEVAPRSRWDTFQRIQRNRQSRIRVKLSRRAGKRSDEILEEDEQQQQFGNSHHNLHLARFGKVMEHPPAPPASTSTPAPNNENDEDIDIVGDDGNNNKGNNTTGSNAASDGNSSNEFPLNLYGPPQFTEADVLACMKDKEENEENEIEVKRETASPIADGAEDDENSTKENIKDNNSAESEEKLENLKEKLKQLEDSSKCSKCLRTLKNPVVNVGCWHVQCEKCWLTSLGTKKCCSLCGTSSSASDLRRVYL